MIAEGSSQADHHRQRIQDAIEMAHKKFCGLTSCGTPPFWDDYLFFEEEFDVLLAEAGRLRCLEHLDFCESLEDLLGAVQERWEEALKIRCCQALLNQPPVSRRNQGSDIARLGGTILADLLGRVDPHTLRRAMSEPPSPSVKRSIWACLVETLPIEARTVFLEKLAAEKEEGDCRTAQAAVMRHLAIEVSSMDRPIRFPHAWIGASCLDLRFECKGRWALNDRVVAHLLAWPNTKDLTDAMRGLSFKNQETLLKGMPPECADAQRVELETGSRLIPWNRILKAQRRLSRWLDFAYLATPTVKEADMDAETPKQRAERLRTEVDAFCDHLLVTYQGLVATMVEVGETDSPLAALIQKKLWERDPNLGNLFERVRIRFDSILMLHDEAIALLLKYLDQDRLAVALIGTPEEVRNQFFRNMSSKATKQMQEAMDFMGPVRGDVIRQAQMEILESVRKLERNGAIRFGGEMEDFHQG